MAPDRIKHYEILHRLGAGGFGTVFYATDTLLRRPVVIKLLDRGTGSVHRLHERMLEEARNASAIEHPNVCAIYEVGEHEDRPFIVMQYVPGRTLRQLIDQEGPLGLHFALSAAIQIADGLAAAHRLGILHRDLKPSNIMVSDDGVVKILDFGLARRKSDEPDREAEPGATADVGAPSEHFGTTAYMAPEQFVLRRSSEQSDVFALGVVLYEMLTARHPFVVASMEPMQIPAAIQRHEPTRPGAIRAEIPEALEEIVLRALAKQPANRFRGVAEVRDALSTLMRSLHLETGLIPGEASALLPTPAAPPREKPRLLSGLVERWFPRQAARAPSNSIAVLPFQDLGSPDVDPLPGFGLGNAVATRLSQLPSLVVRPLSAFLSVSGQILDPVEAGERLQAERVLLGSYTRSGDSLVVHWQLLDVESRAIRSGGTLTTGSADVAVVQDQVAGEIYSELLRSGDLAQPGRQAQPQVTMADLPDPVREEYLEARALLAGFALRASHREDLEQARERFERVIEQAPDFAPGHAGLGTVYLRSVRNGFGGIEHLRASQRHLTRALELDPDLLEAKLYRASVLLWDGEKESARLDLQYLLREAPDDAEVCLASGVILQLDGMLDEALRVQGAALRLNPAVAPRVYYYRARVHLFQRNMDLAIREIEKGLTLEPRHTLLRNVLGYWHFYQGDLDAAIAVLEDVLADEPSLRLAYPTLAMCYAQAGRSADAAALINEETLAAAAADAEIAYRVATYYSVARVAGEAMTWLRQAIYRGNENYPAFATNPAWEWLRESTDFRAILEELSAVYRLNRSRWEPVIASLPT